MFFAARNNFISLLKLILKKIHINHEKLFPVYTILLYLLLLIIAIAIGDLGPIFNIVGAIASNSIGFIIPPIFYICLILYKHKKAKIHFILACLMIVFAIPIGIFAIVS